MSSFHYCASCNRSFAKRSHYRTHIKYSSKHQDYCSTCDRYFVSESALEDHLQYSLKHLDVSDLLDRLLQRCTEQLEKLNLRNQYHETKCSLCGLRVEDDLDLDGHLQNDHQDVYCIDCKKYFQNVNNLKMHRMASTHETKVIECPYRACGALFLTMACLIAHWEAGCCSSGVNIEKLENIFKELDKKGLFIKSELIKPLINFEPTRLEARKKYQCPFCSKPKIFNQLSGLEQHLNSPKHKSRGFKPFTCPSRLCSHASFTSLSGLLSHRERGKCERGHSRELTKLCNQLSTVIPLL